MLCDAARGGRPKKDTALQQTKRRPGEHCTRVQSRSTPNISFWGQMVKLLYRYLQRPRACVPAAYRYVITLFKGRYLGRHESTVMKMTKRAAVVVEAEVAVPASQRLTRKIVIGEEHDIIIYAV